MHNNVGFGLGCRACNGNVADDRQLGELLNVVVTLNLVAKHFNEVNQTDRQGNAENQCYEQDDRSLRAYLAINQRIVDNLTLVGCGCKRDRVLLALLQEHKVKTRLNLLLTTNLSEDALLLRS